MMKHLAKEESPVPTTNPYSHSHPKDEVYNGLLYDEGNMSHHQYGAVDRNGYYKQMQYHPREYMYPLPPLSYPTYEAGSKTYIVLITLYYSSAYH
jgi:hypothetical protein